MKYLSLLAGLALAGCVTYPPQPILPMGASPAQVTSIVGLPKSKSRDGSLSTWNYGEGMVCVFKDGHLVATNFNGQGAYPAGTYFTQTVSTYPAVTYYTAPVYTTPVYAAPAYYNGGWGGWGGFWGNGWNRPWWGNNCYQGYNSGGCWNGNNGNNCNNGNNNKKHKHKN